MNSKIEIKMQQVQEHILKISEITDETPTVKSFKVKLPKDINVNFYPGQFFMVSFPNDSEIKTARAYSIASSPEQKKYLEIALNKVGPFTTKLFMMKEGDLLKFKGPYGKFYFSEEMKNDIVLIAGGTGITPLIGILRYCTDKKLDNKIKFFYSIKTPEEIIYHEEIKKIKQKNPNLDYFITITRTEDHHVWDGRRGRIESKLLEENIENPQESIYFLCGPKEFVDNIVSMLQNLGVRREKIKTDVWG